MVPPPGPGPIEDRPFTAFGQYGPGRLDVRVLNQGTWWVNRDGVAFRIDSEMSDEYVATVTLCERPLLPPRATPSHNVHHG